MKKPRLFLKSILQTLQAGAEHAEILPGNFVAISPENKLTIIPWGSENLQRVIEQLLDVAELRLGTLQEFENAQILELQKQLSEAQREISRLHDKLYSIEDALRNF